MGVWGCDGDGRTEEEEEEEVCGGVCVCVGVVVVRVLENRVRGGLRARVREREGCEQTDREGCVCIGEGYCLIEEEETS